MAAALAIGGTVLAVAQTPAAGQTIFVLLADDLGVDQVGAYKTRAGEPSEDVPRTPNLDRMAAEGVIFQNAYANPLCSPTRATILTGRYAYNQGMGTVVSEGYGEPFDESEVTLPELLRNAASGFTSAAFGKWHLSYKWTSPNASRGRNHMVNDGGGFDYFRGNVDNLMGASGGYRHHLTRTLRRNDADPEQPFEIEPDFIDTVYAPVAKIDAVLAFMDPTCLPVEHDLFVYLAFNLAHETFEKPPDELHTQDEQLGAAWRSLPQVWDGQDEATARIYYKAMVEALDAEIGRLRQQMPWQRRANATFLFVGDNGTPGGVTVAPFRKNHAKGTPYEGGGNVPLIVCGRGVTAPPGTISDALVQTTDVFATVADLAGIRGPRLKAALRPRPEAPPNVINSHSLLPLLDADAGNDAEWPRTYVITEMFQPNGGEGDPMDTIDALDPPRFEPPLRGYAAPQLGAARVWIEGGPLNVGNVARVVVAGDIARRCGILRIVTTWGTVAPEADPSLVVGKHRPTGKPFLVGPGVGVETELLPPGVFHLLDVPLAVGGTMAEEVVFTFEGAFAKQCAGFIGRVLVQAILVDGTCLGWTTDITNIVSMHPPRNIDVKSIRGERYKLIQTDNGGREQFFDLLEDPWEEYDLVARGATALAGAPRRAYETLRAQLNAEVTSGRRVGE